MVTGIRWFRSMESENRAKILIRPFHQLRSQESMRLKPCKRDVSVHPRQRTRKTQQNEY